MTRHRPGNEEQPQGIFECPDHEVPLLLRAARPNAMPRCRRKTAILDLSESRLAQHLGEAVGIRKQADAFHQILIGGLVLGDKAADLGSSLKE